MAKRILRELRLDKIAAVDKPCQEGAQAVIIKRDASGDDYWKRDFTDKERERLAGTGAAMPDGSFPIQNEKDLENAIHAIGRAKDEAAARKHIIDRASSLGLTRLLPDGWVSKSAVNGITRDHEGANLMDDKDLQKKIDDAVATATADLSKKLADAEAMVAKAESLTPKEMEFMNGLSQAEKKKFMAAEADERKTMMTKAAEADPVVYKSADGTEFRKSDDARLVSLAKQADADRAELAKAREREAEAGFEKRAGEIMKSLPGETKVHAAVIKAIDSIADETVRKAAFEAIKAGNDAIAKGFDRFGIGAGGQDASSPEAKLDAMAKARIEKGTEKNFAAAYDAVLKSEEGAALYAEMRNARMTAAE